MSVTLKMANVWRVLRDVNLDAIEASASHRFVVLIAADDREDAEGVRTLLSGAGQPGGHPWLVAGAASDGWPDEVSKPWFVLLVSRRSQLSPDMSAIRTRATAEAARVITVRVGGPPGPGTPGIGEAERLVAPALDSRLARDLAVALARLAEPEWRLALARQLPEVRTSVVNLLIDETAKANASYAMASGLAEIVPLLTAPMNFGDMVILTKNQLVMGYRIALACGLDGSPRKLIPEILGVLGGGLLFRQLARQLVGLIPVLGLVPKVSIAYGGTYAIGRAVAGWASEGREVSAEALQRFSREGMDRGRELARNLVENARGIRQRSRTRSTFREHVPAPERAHPGSSDV